MKERGGEAIQPSVVWRSLSFVCCGSGASSQFFRGKCVVVSLQINRRPHSHPSEMLCRWLEAVQEPHPLTLSCSYVKCAHQLAQVIAACSKMQVAWTLHRSSIQVGVAKYGREGSVKGAGGTMYRVFKGRAPTSRSLWGRWPDGTKGAALCSFHSHTHLRDLEGPLSGRRRSTELLVSGLAWLR